MHKLKTLFYAIAWGLTLMDFPSQTTTIRPCGFTCDNLTDLQDLMEDVPSFVPCWKSCRTAGIVQDEGIHPAMTTPSPHTIRLHRVLRSTPDRIYRAFLEADAKVKWLPPNGFTGKIHHLDPQVGGTYRMSFTNFTTGSSHTFGGTYLDLVPNQRIVHTDRFEDPKLPGEIRVTIELREVFCGTELSITQENVPAVIPAEACHLGWQESLVLLAKLVETGIPDE